ncbi:hypothetical protein ACHAW5_001412, partial [Stephanodiscus triporus]
MSISASSAAASSATSAAATINVNSDDNGASDEEESGDLVTTSNDKDDSINDEVDNVSAVNLDDEFFSAARDIQNWMSRIVGTAEMEDRRFQELFGARMEIVVHLWEMMEEDNLLPEKSKPKHLLWTLSFMKIVFESRLDAAHDVGNDCLMSIDGTDFRVKQQGPTEDFTTHLEGEGEAVLKAGRGDRRGLNLDWDDHSSAASLKDDSQPSSSSKTNRRRRPGVVVNLDVDDYDANAAAMPPIVLTTTTSSVATATAGSGGVGEQCATRVQHAEEALRCGGGFISSSDVIRGFILSSDVVVGESGRSSASGGRRARLRSQSRDDNNNNSGSKSSPPPPLGVSSMRRSDSRHRDRAHRSMSRTRTSDVIGVGRAGEQQQRRQSQQGEEQQPTQQQREELLRDYWKRRAEESKERVVTLSIGGGEQPRRGGHPRQHDERLYRERDRDRSRQGERSRSPSPSPEGAQLREDNFVDDLWSQSMPASPPPPSSSSSSVAFQKPGQGQCSQSSCVCRRAATAEFVFIGGCATTIRRRRHDDNELHGPFHRRGPGSWMSRPDGRSGGAASSSAMMMMTTSTTVTKARRSSPPPPAPPFAAVSVNDNSAAAEVADAEGALPLHRSTRSFRRFPPPETTTTTTEEEGRGMISVVEALLSAHPAAARVNDVRGMLPLHWASAF